MLWANDRISASIRPLQSIIANIVDGSKEVDLIIDQNESIHHYQLKPNKVMTLTNSDIIVLIDKDFEIFLDKFLTQLDKNISVIEVAKLPNIKLLKSEEKCSHHEDDEDHHHAFEYDYHLWLDIENVKTISKELTNIFIQRYPQSAEVFNHNLSLLLKKLDNLDSIIRAKTLLSKDKNFIVTHDAYEYFINRYGLNKPKSISIDHDHNIGARDLLSLQQAIESEKVVCVFEEPQFDSKIIAKLQQNTKVKIGQLDAEWGALNIPTKDVYFNIMESLADSFSKCLK